METFKGSAFHTSRWDYNVDLKDKRVVLSVRVQPRFRWCLRLPKRSKNCLFSNAHPSSIDVRDQRETTQEERQQWAQEPGWARARRARFAKISAGRSAIKANDDYLAGKVPDFKARKTFDKPLSAQEMIERQLGSNFRIMEQIRARVDAIVEDPKTRQR